MMTKRRLAAVQAVVILICALSAAAQSPVTPEPSLYREGAPHIKEQKTAPHQMPDFIELAKVVSPSVANISVEGAAEAEEDDDGALPFPFKQPQEPPARSTGSGFIISSDGLITTSNHVVDKAERIVVRLLDDRNEYTATVIGKDPKTDIALLKIDVGRPLPAVFLGDSDKVEVGEWVMAIGNQFELGQTITVGIVSARSRRVPSTGGSPYDVYIQTDASINPGSSGGPLVNSKGQVIGVNTAIFTPSRRSMNETGFNIGIGFAVPVNTVKRVLPELKNKGKITRGLLGVIIQQVDADVAQVLGLSAAEGALVADVVADSPAKRAGFRRKDIITKFNGKKIEDYNQLPMLVADTPVGTTVDLEVIRDGKPMNLKVVIEELKDEQVAKKEEFTAIEEIGLSLTEKGIRVHTKEGVESGKKVTVSRILPGSVAEKAGFMMKDRLLELSGTKVTSAGQVKEFFKALPKDKPILILVQRKKGTRFLTLRLN